MVVGLLVVLGVAELGLRSFETMLSGDVAHMEAIPTIVRETVASEGESVLLWGNSLLGEGVDRAALEEGLRTLGSRNYAVGKVNPDGTTPLEWSYLLRSTIEIPSGSRSGKPDLFVLAFGPGHLVDRSPTGSLERLALYHVGREDLVQFLLREVQTLDERAAFLSARTLRLVALGERIQPRVLDLAIPEYRERAPLLLARNADPTVDLAADYATDAGSRYRHFRRIVDDLAVAGIPLILLPMPEAQPWELSDDELRVIGECRVTVLDIRTSAGLPPERFPDGTHMDSEGRGTFTAVLTSRLAGLLDGSHEELVPARCRSSGTP